MFKVKDNVIQNINQKPNHLKSFATWSFYPNMGLPGKKPIKIIPIKIK